MGFLCSFLFAVLCGYICGKIAKAHGWDIILAWLIGAIFNIVGVIGYIIAVIVKDNK